MSADNFVGVRPNSDGSYSIFEYGCMSILDEDCMYLADAKPTKVISCDRGSMTRAFALEKAHDLVNAMDICEYGVVELNPVPTEPCGRCYICINERKIIAKDVERCDICHEPFSYSDWRTGYYDPDADKHMMVHNHCERR